MTVLGLLAACGGVESGNEALGKGVPIAEGSLIITEVMPSPEGAKPWFELYNRTGSEVSLQNVSLFVYDTDGMMVGDGIPLGLSGQVYNVGSLRSGESIAFEVGDERLSKAGSLVLSGGNDFNIDYNYTIDEAPLGVAAQLQLSTEPWVSWQRSFYEGAYTDVWCTANQVMGGEQNNATRGAVNGSCQAEVCGLEQLEVSTATPNPEWGEAVQMEVYLRNSCGYPIIFEAPGLGCLDTTTTIYEAIESADKVDLVLQEHSTLTHACSADEGTTIWVIGAEEAQRTSRDLEIGELDFGYYTFKSEVTINGEKKTSECTVSVY